MEKFMVTDPAVFAVGTNYQIMVPVTADAVMWVRVAEEVYYDDSNGILRSSTRMHRMEVPMKALDQARKYTIVYRKIIDRKPYFPEMEEAVEKEYAFYPVEGDSIHAYHISDVHNDPQPACDAGVYFGADLDFLILNGDIPDHSGAIENFNDIYKIAAHITHGEKPVIFARGNHDNRGIYAENIAEYTPNQGGRLFYSFRLGPIWGIVLDCGEDKEDTHAEYGETVACTPFRKKQTAYLRTLIEQKEKEYAAPGVMHRLVICHIPFTHTQEEPFNTAIDIYTEWSRLLREEIHPEVMICGHEHCCEIWEVGGPKDDKGQPCPIVVGAKPTREEGNSRGFIGTAFTFLPDRIEIAFTDHLGKVREQHVLTFPKEAAALSHKDG